MSAPAVTWLGHATALIELDGVRALTDPVLRDRIGPLVRVARSVDRGRLGTVDCVMLSHLHADHADIPSLRSIARDVPVYAPAGAGGWLRRQGVDHVHELSAGDRAQIGNLEVSATPAVHDGRRRPFGHAAEPIGYMVRGSRTVYFAGDTDLFAAMADLRGSVDLALVPVWGWGPTLGPGHLDPDKAAAAVGMIAPAVAVPIHWGTFALGPPLRRPDDPERPARQFSALVRRYSPSVDVRVLQPGGVLGL